MKSRWNDGDAARCASPLELRVYSSRLLGQEPALVLHGGGNTSVKASVPDLFGEAEEILYIKGSGWDLATIEARGFAPVRLDPLRRMAELVELSDTAMVGAQRAAMTDAGAPTPSVEAILHAILPFRFVDHTHADAVVAVSNSEGGEERIREIYGDSVLVVPYVMPGFILAKAVRDLTRSLDWGRIEGIVLLHHGIFSFGPDAKTSYERMIGLVSKSEEYLRRHGALGKAPTDFTDQEEVGEQLQPESLRSLAELRLAVGHAKRAAVVARVDRSAGARAFASRPDVGDIATRGPLTPDHVIRTKPLPLVAEGDWAAAVADYSQRYWNYFSRHERPGLSCLDPAPRWVVWKDQGFVSFGTSVQEAAIVGDLARHTARAIGWAEGLGGWRALPEAELFEVEYWELEQAKLRKSGARPPLAGKIALVTGAAGGIGRACAEALLEQGATVVATDINWEIETRFGREGALDLVADATDRSAVEHSIAECVGRFGGLDILVSNAGAFPESQRIEAIEQNAWDRALALNLSSHLSLLRSAVPYLRLGFEPSVVIIGSKNVPAPGPGAASYSVAKAGLTQLARVAALELGKDGIRVNVLHPHLVIDTGTWTAEVLAARADHYGLSVEEYQRNNLLHVKISSRDVANAVVALAGPTFAKTTGAQIPIDGGSERVV